MNYINEKGRVIHYVNGTVYVNDSPQFGVSSPDQYIQTVTEQRRIVESMIDKVQKDVTKKVLSENVNYPLSNTDYTIAKESVLNEELSVDPFSIQMRQITKNYNPFGKHQIVLESGECVSISDKTLTKITESKTIPKSLSELVSLINE